jgi:hypothetical protein
MSEQQTEDREAALGAMRVVREFDSIGTQLERLTPYTGDSVRVPFELPTGASGIYEWFTKPTLRRKSSAVKLGRLSIQGGNLGEGIDKLEYDFYYLVRAGKRRPHYVTSEHEAWVGATIEGHHASEVNIPGEVIPTEYIGYANLEAEADFEQVHGHLASIEDVLIPTK